MAAIVIMDFTWADTIAVGHYLMRLVGNFAAIGIKQQMPFPIADGIGGHEHKRNIKKRNLWRLRVEIDPRAAVQVGGVVRGIAEHPVVVVFVLGQQAEGQQEQKGKYFEHGATGLNGEKSQGSPKSDRVTRQSPGHF